MCMTQHGRINIGNALHLIDFDIRYYTNKIIRLYATSLLKLNNNITYRNTLKVLKEKVSVLKINYRL